MSIRLCFMSSFEVLGARLDLYFVVNVSVFLGILIKIVIFSEILMFILIGLSD